MATGTGEESATDGEETGDSGERFSQHQRAILITSTATILGIVAGVASTLYATTDGLPDDTLGFGILVAAVIIQFPFYQAVGIDIREFDTKDQLYIFFMSFSMWFITWGILLTTGGLQ
jgi:hypothetical protein